MTTLSLRSIKTTPVHMVRVSDLRQWTYCPRVVWWTHVCPVGKLESFKMKKGKEKEGRLQQLQRRRTLKAFGMQFGTVQSNVQLTAPKIGLTGKLDMLVTHGPKRIPAEIKFTNGPVGLNHQIQLAGYALMLEEIYGVPVPYGFVVRLPNDTVEIIDLPPGLRELTEKTIGAIRTTIESETIPSPNPMIGRCQDCEYRLYCGDIGITQIRSKNVQVLIRKHVAKS